jgi:hypothetical protein
MSLPIQRLPSCAIFSSSVIAARSRPARSAAGLRGSRQGWSVEMDKKISLDEYSFR